ncbi:hypothetical protein HOLleu_30526 [Holothuria leucospilota]|uniref:Uncharacterized protein n=1 Tax=Holothuria leucospilota TaxID=206669 RepID=A0A9Q1BKG3_HOLLE|nr:hypothetical protein HOLleu_30526 [Holothuria leucospilota]
MLPCRLSAITWTNRQDPQIPTTTFLRLTELVLTQNCFQFNGRFFRQVKGVAMGTKMGPSVACLTMGHFEEQLFSQYTGSHPFLYKRNIETLRKDPSTRDLFPEPPITAFRVEKNISKHLVRASHPQQPTDNTPAMATFGKTRFASHINFLGTCLRKNVIPRGFKLNFHVQTVSDFHFRRDTSRYLRSCSFSLMRSTIRSMVRKKAGFDRTIQDQGSLLFNTLPEAGEVRFLIHVYNRRLHNFLLDSKAKTLASLLPDPPSTHTPPSDTIQAQDTKLVVTIPPDLELSSSERSVLAKGLNFVPLNPLPDEFSIRRDVSSFCRKLRLRHHFGITDQPDNTSPEDFLNTLGSTRSSWTPKSGENNILDSVIESINKDVDRLLPPKRTTLSNLSPEEREALLSLKRNKNLIIKAADKGGAVVVWQKDLFAAVGSMERIGMSRWI